MGSAKKEIAAWLLLAVAVVGFNCIQFGGPIVSDDSFQYVSIAENLVAGNGIRTSIVHFDQERSHGELPAPVTWFPAGYPAAIALLALLGIPAVWAGLIVSGASFCVVVATTAWLCCWYELSPVARRVVLFCLVMNASSILYGSAVLSESLYTAVSIASVALIAAVSEQTERPGQERRLGLWALCGLMVGISCWVRYAGLFLYAGLGVFLALEVVFRRRRELVGPVVALVAASIPVGVLLLRNSYLSGSWRGGNTVPRSSSVAVVAEKFAGAAYQLLFGALHLDEIGALEVLAVLSACVCAVVAIWIAFQHREAMLQGLRGRRNLLLVFTYLGVYFAALTYISFFSLSAVNDRYCYPLWPLLLLLGGLAMTLVAPQMGNSKIDRTLAASAATVLGCYVFLNVQQVFEPPRSSSVFGDRRIAALLNERTPSGEPLHSWIEANVPTDANIVAVEGQATGHVLRRKTVSLVSHEYSKQAWEAPQMRELMTRFDADFLILYPETPSRPAPQAQKESVFLSALARGDKSPDWLRLVAENPHAKVFRRDEPSSMGFGHPMQPVEQVPR